MCRALCTSVLADDGGVCAGLEQKGKQEFEYYHRRVDSIDDILQRVFISLLTRYPSQREPCISRYLLDGSPEHRVHYAVSNR